MLISIVVTCYNRADMVTTALDSVWKQTYRPLELIVVDDGSTDNSMEVIEEWRKGHPDVGGFTSLAKTFPNGRQCAARNRGLALAHGEYIQFVDDDDWLYPEAISKKKEYASRHPELDLIVNQLDYVRDGRKISHTRLSLPQHGENLIAWILDHECLLVATLMFKTATLRKIGAWREDLIFGEDMEISMRLAILGGRFGLVDECLNACRLHSQVRHTTTTRDRLPNDFCAKLFVGLYELCREKNKINAEMTNAFAAELLRNAVQSVKTGHFSAAEADLEARFDISARSDYMGLDYRLLAVRILWRIQHCLWSLKMMIKRFLLSKK